MEFSNWGKTARLLSDVVITEKIDGSNCAIIIEEITDQLKNGPVIIEDGFKAFNIGAQSRNRLITPEDDHQGFAAWVQDNADSLAAILGPGTHFGEWTRKGLKRPKFFLFNTARWFDVETDYGLECVPIMYFGRYYEGLVAEQLKLLENFGSAAYDAPPEGVVIFWKADNTLKKAFCSGVSKQKGNI